MATSRPVGENTPILQPIGTPPTRREENDNRVTRVFINTAAILFCVGGIGAPIGFLCMIPILAVSKDTPDFCLVL